jgi:hypothetical protein
MASGSPRAPRAVAALSDADELRVFEGPGQEPCGPGAKDILQGRDGVPPDINIIGPKKFRKKVQGWTVLCTVMAIPAEWRGSG